MQFTKYICIIIYLMIATGCNRENNANSLKFDSNGLCILSNWVVIGPFSYDSIKQKPEETFYNQDLDKFSLNEDSFRISDIKMLQKNKNIKLFFLDKKFTTHNLTSFAENIQDKSNYYLATTIKSDQDQDLVLLVDGAASLKLWFNQELVYQERNRLYIRKIANRFIPIHLKQGPNILFAKLNRESNKHAWGIDAAITSQKVAEQIFSSNYISDFVTNPIIIDTLNFYTGPLNVDKVELLGENNLLHPEIYKKSNDVHFISGLGSITDGFYDFRIITKSDTLTEKIFKGNILKYYYKLKEVSQMNNDQNQEGMALIERIDFIIKSAGVFPPLSSYGNDKECNIVYSNTNLVFWVERFKSFLNKDNSDLMLKSYQSPIDNKIYHFVMNLPKDFTLKPKIPLIVVMPYAIKDQTFPSSWYLGNLEQILADCKLASERGFAICWLFSRGPNYSLEASFDDFNSSLNQISKEFNNVDISKIYLTGDCLGAERALRLSEYFPGRIGALSLRSPLTRIDLYKAKLNNITTLPIYIEHGVYDNEIPINEMRLFIKEISKDIKQLKYREIEEGHFSFRKDYRKSAFDFFKRIHNE